MLTAIVLSIIAVLMALTVSIRITSGLEMTWAYNLLRSILQDLIFTPYINMGISYLLVRGIEQNKKFSFKIRREVAKVADGHVSQALRFFARLQRSDFDHNEVKAIDRGFSLFFNYFLAKGTCESAADSCRTSTRFLSREYSPSNAFESVSRTA